MPLGGPILRKCCLGQALVLHRCIALVQNASDRCPVFGSEWGLIDNAVNIHVASSY